MQDGQNLFFPEEAFRHEYREVDETSQVLRAIRAIEDLIIVGVYSNERREEEYTKPGYEAYARSIVKELVPAEQLFLRTTNDPVDRSMWGFLVRRRRRFTRRGNIPAYSEAPFACRARSPIKTI